MVQIVRELYRNNVEELEIPAPGEQVIPGVRWGLSHALFTPAYWVAQLWYARRQCDYADYRRGASLREEVAACLLGGHGITAEMNDAAFARLRSLGLLLAPAASAQALAEALSEPMMVRGRSARYRFPHQKARFLHAALMRLGNEAPPSEDLPFREWLLGFAGIGPKTASWVTRNWLDSNRVAIIDVHVFRAGTVAGVFDGREVIARDYDRMEGRFLRFAEALGIETRRLDVLMWRQMKDAGDFAIGYFTRKLAREGFSC